MMKSVKYVLLSLILICEIFSGYAQKKTYRGAVISEKTKLGIPYVTMQLIQEKVSVSADENGTFNIQSTNAFPNDTLLIKGIGYLSLKVSVKNIKDGQQFELRESIKILDEVSISTKIKRSKKVLNKFSRSNFNSQTHFTYQYAQPFVAPEGYSYLESIVVGRVIHPLGSPFMYGQVGGRIKFRIRIYDVNPLNGGPGEDLCLKKIEIEDEGSSMMRIDLKKYNIMIPNNMFFVAVEKMLIPYNERYRLFREMKQLPDLSKVPVITYNIYFEPTLYSDYRNRKKGKLWHIDRKGGEWKIGDGILGITATVTN